MVFSRLSALFESKRHTLQSLEMAEALPIAGRCRSRSSSGPARDVTNPTIAICQLRAGFHTSSVNAPVLVAGTWDDSAKTGLEAIFPHAASCAHAAIPHLPD